MCIAISAVVCCYIRCRKRVAVNSDGSLSFNTVRRNDNGVYKCVAWNGISSWFSAEAHLTVTCTFMLPSPLTRYNIKLVAASMCVQHTNAMVHICYIAVDLLVLEY